MVLEFLAYLRLVHRNLKPSNIMLDRRGMAKLTVFHLLKEIQENPGMKDDVLTTEGISLGTPEYMPIEQCKDASPVDYRSDLYSLDVILTKCCPECPLF